MEDTTDNEYPVAEFFGLGMVISESISLLVTMETADSQLSVVLDMETADKFVASLTTYVSEMKLLQKAVETMPVEAAADYISRWTTRHSLN